MISVNVDDLHKSNNTNTNKEGQMPSLCQTSVIKCRAVSKSAADRLTDTITKWIVRNS